MEHRTPVGLYARQPVPGIPDTADMAFIGANIKRAREHLGLTQKELAERSGISEGALGDLETGRQKSSTKIHKIARALSLTPEQLEAGALPGAPHEEPAQAYLSAKEEELLRLYRAAPPAVKRAIEGAAGKVHQPPGSSPPDRPRKRS
jgi:transcriptional regulator with XRE-family HTH domain